MAADFTYDALPRSPDYIRLLEISRLEDGSLTGRLRPELFFNQPTYEVLSFSKGPSDGEPRHMIINGSPLAISDNLYRALQDIWESPRLNRIWVEEICVNLNDVHEKNYQRSLMYLIYSRAQRVVIWLSVSEHPIIRDGESGGFGQYGAKYKASQEIAASPYWKQAWSIQDIGLAANLDIYFGTYCFTWQEFRNRVLHSCEEMKKSVPTVLERKLNEYERQHWAFDTEDEIQHPLETLLEEFKDMQVADRRDGIFAFLSLASDWSDDIIPVDYEISLYELYARTIQFQQSRTALNTRSYEIYSKTLDRPLRLMKFSQLVQYILGDGLEPEADSTKHSEAIYTARGSFCGEVQLLGPTYRQCISSARTNATWKKTLESHLRTSNKELLKARESNDKYSYMFQDWSDSYVKKIKAIPTKVSFGYQTSAADASQEEDWETIDRPKDNTKDTNKQPESQEPANEERREGPIRFLGSNGILGFVPVETQVGDSIYTFWDCAIAVVLRKAVEPDRWTIVGRADVAPVDKFDRRPDTIWHNALMLDVAKQGRGYTLGVGETFPYMMNFKLDLPTLQQLTS